MNSLIRWNCEILFLNSVGFVLTVLVKYVLLYKWNSETVLTVLVNDQVFIKSLEIL
jgi:hypothetical protein